MTTKLEDDALINGIVIGSLFAKRKETALTLYASEFLGLSLERLNALIHEATSRMLTASEVWAIKGMIRP